MKGLSPGGIAFRFEGVVDAGLGQDIGEREAVVAREAGAELIEAHPGRFGAWRSRSSQEGRFAECSYRLVRWNIA